MKFINMWGLNIILAFKNFPAASWEQAAAGITGGAETLEMSWAISYKVKQSLTIWPDDPTHRYLPKRNENKGSHKNWDGKVYCSFIHNCPKLDTTQTSFDWRMDKQTGTSVELNSIQQ